MATQTITIRVSPEAARIYNTATAEQQRKLEALLSLNSLRWRGPHGHWKKS